MHSPLVYAVVFSQALVVLWNMAVALLIVKNKINLEVIVWGWLMCSVTWALGFYHNIAFNYKMVSFEPLVFILLSIADTICVLGILAALGASPKKEESNKDGQV